MNNKHLAAIAALALGGPASAQLPFDLVEIGKDGHPQHPGIDFQRHPIDIQASEAGGMCTVDINNDDYIDVLLTDTEGHPNHLYINQGDGTFVEEAALYGIDEPSKRRSSAAFFDMENDADLDLVTCGYPGLALPDYDLYTLYRSDGAPGYGYTDVTASAGGFALAPTMEGSLLGYCAGVTVGDYNNDGYLDFFNAFFYRSIDHLHDQPRLWKSTPNLTLPGPGQTDYSERVFLDASIEAGLDAPIDGWIWTPTLVDVNSDGLLDLHLAVDSGLDVLRLNNGDGTFGPDIATSVGISGAPEGRSEMGVAWGDPDFDLDLDLYTTNAIQDDRFWWNKSSFGLAGTGLEYQDLSASLGTAKCNYGWGTAFLDMDNDRDLDLLAVCGLAVGTQNWLWRNEWPAKLGMTGVPQMTEVTDLVPEFEKDNADADTARGMSPFDFDNDGDLDIFVTRYGASSFVTSGPLQKATVYENTLSSSDKWMQIDLLAKDGSRNTIGARVYVRAGVDQFMHRTVIAGTSFLTQEPYRQHIGLGADDPDWIAVRWFNGKITVIDKGLQPNKLITIRQKNFSLSGDMNGDRDIDSTDLALLKIAIKRPRAYDSVFSAWPWQITGDLNGDNVLDDIDVNTLDAMVP